MITIGWLVYVCQVKDAERKLPNAWELSYAESHKKTAKWDSYASLVLSSLPPPAYIHNSMDAC